MSEVVVTSVGRGVGDVDVEDQQKSGIVVRDDGRKHTPRENTSSNTDTPEYRKCDSSCCWKYFCCCCCCDTWPFTLYWPGGPYFVDFGTHDGPLDIIGESAYVYFFIPNVFAFLGALVIVVFQVYLLYVLLRDVVNKDANNVPEGPDKTTALVSAIFLLVLRVLPHVGQGFELLWQGIQGCCCCGRCDDDKLLYKKSFWSSVLLVWVGIVQSGVAGVTVAIGILTALNVGSSLTEIITRVSVATFIEGVDETAYAFLKYFSKPSWYSESQTKLVENFGGKPSLDDDQVEALQALLNDSEILAKVQTEQAKLKKE